MFSSRFPNVLQPFHASNVSIARSRRVDSDLLYEFVILVELINPRPQQV